MKCSSCEPAALTASQESQHIMVLEDIINWLQEGDEWDAAEVLSQCELHYVDLDMGFPLGDDLPIDILEARIHAPRRVLDRIGTELKSEAASIDHAIKKIAEAGERCCVEHVAWVPRVGVQSDSPSDASVEETLTKLDVNLIRAAWEKALQRREADPDGAITAARTLLESVCKHILTSAGIQYPRNADLPKLYHMVCERLTLSPSQYVDKETKRVLGSCQSVVSGISFLRNQLGDAHASDSGLEIPGPRFGELAVNLAGAVATFLAKAWQETQAQGR